MKKKSSKNAARKIASKTKKSRSTAASSKAVAHFETEDPTPKPVQGLLIPEDLNQHGGADAPGKLVPNWGRRAANRKPGLTRRAQSTVHHSRMHRVNSGGGSRGVRRAGAAPVDPSRRQEAGQQEFDWSELPDLAPQLDCGPQLAPQRDLPPQLAPQRSVPPQLALQRDLAPQQAQWVGGVEIGMLEELAAAEDDARAVLLERCRDAAFLCALVVFIGLMWLGV